MQNLFDAEDRNAIVRRLSALEPSSPRQWGKMTIEQMLAHCVVALEVPCGDRVKKQSLFGRVLSPFVRSSVLGPRPMMRNAPTGADYRIVDQREFEREKARLSAIIQRFCGRGPAGAEGVVHEFFGRLTGDQWGRLMFKHLDHHLQQFGA